MRGILCVSFLLALTCLDVSLARKNWALLIAGSNTYVNYRHQADICHAYQIMTKAGIPDEQIVVMMYDDIAHNKENPVKGNIINHPKGDNVYEGVLKDYTGKHVSAKTFLAVLQGDKEEVKRLTGKKKGKVIDSGPDDYVFVNYVDHGGKGVLGMPQGENYLKATEVVDALKKMHEAKKFAKLVFFLEACESGSIFDKLLPKDINVYATTAASPTEPSWACYKDKKRHIYLGDTYSVSWMEDTDALSSLNSETFDKLMADVKKQVNKSHVEQYGDLSIASEVLEDFFGNNKQSKPANLSHVIKSAGPGDDQIPSYMVPIESLKSRIMEEPANSTLRSVLGGQLARLETTIAWTDQLFWNIARNVYRDVPEPVVYSKVMNVEEDLDNLPCYYNALDNLLAHCPGLDLNSNDRALRKLNVLVNLCNHNDAAKVARAAEEASAVSRLCKKMF